MDTRQPRPITFWCEHGSHEVTEDHAPGPTPRYCRECYEEAQRALNALTRPASEGIARAPMSRLRKLLKWWRVTFAGECRFCDGNVYEWSARKRLCTKCDRFQ